MKHLLFFLVLLSFLAAAGQKNYEDSLETYIKDYVAKHEVVKNKDRKHLHFYSVNKDFRIATRFEKTDGCSSTEIIIRQAGANVRAFVLNHQ